MTLQIPPLSNVSKLSNHFESLEKELATKINIIPEKENHSSLISENPITIEIVGIPIRVEQCRVRVLVLLDEMVRPHTLVKKKYLPSY